MVKAATYGTEGITPTLYRLPEVLRSQTIFIVEGEKDADNLGALGLTATTSPMGAGKWKPHYNRYLQGKKVAIIPDNDAAGRKHARAIAAGLVVVAEAVKIVDLPNLKPKGDISDWLANGGSKESLLERLQRTPLFTDASKVSEGEQDNQSQWSKPIFPLTDFGNGERFAAQNSENTRFCHTWGKWLLWSGKHWEIDETSRIYQLAKITVRNIYAEASQIEDDERRRHIPRHARASESSADSRRCYLLLKPSKRLR